MIHTANLRRLAFVGCLVWLIAQLKQSEYIVPAASAAEVVDDVVKSNQLAEANETSYVLRWSSSGGGWRAMMANMGFANAFARANILSQSSCHFTAISGNSGAAWFLVQFFYSPNFFARVTQSNPVSLQSFALEWTEAYYEFLANDSGSVCGWISWLFGFVPLLSDLAGVCNMFVQSEASFAGFLLKILESASVSAYGDADFVTRLANAENRIPVLRDTDLFLQTALSPTGRFRMDKSSDYNVEVIGDAKGRDLLVPLAAHYAVKKGRDPFIHYALMDEDHLPLTTRLESAPRQFHFEDWEDYHLYDPELNVSGVFQQRDASQDISNPRYVAEAFGGMDSATVTQAAALSSSGLAYLSGYVPSYLAQFFSVVVYDILNDPSRSFLSKWWDSFTTRVFASWLYNTMFDFAFCSQWPNPCGSSDAWFLDGGYSDGPCKFVVVRTLC